jgi:hypothetical protein|nr:MAG TPA: 30S ribosomal protein S2 [Caudoviricetes sp.]
MLKYIPDELYIHQHNKKQVEEILKSAPETCLHIPGVMTMEDVIQEIRELGEDKIADYLS